MLELDELAGPSGLGHGDELALDRALEDSLVHFKGLVEFKDVASDEVLADF